MTSHRAQLHRSPIYHRIIAAKHGAAAPSAAALQAAVIAQATARHQPIDFAGLDADTGVRRAGAATPWVSKRDLLDALTTFSIVFTGAMVFLL